MSALLTPKKTKASPVSGKKRPPTPPLRLPVFEEEAGEPIALPSGLRHELSGLIARYDRLALWRGAMIIVLALAGLLLLQAVLDDLLHLSVSIRAVFLILDLAVVGVLIFVGPYRDLKKRPNLERSALLAQKKFPSLRGSLVAAVQLTSLKKGVPRRSALLVQELLVRVERDSAKLRFPEVLPARRAWQWTAAAAALCLLLGALFYFYLPVSSLLLHRLALSNEPFPAETTLVAVSKDLTVSVGDNVQLEARAQGIIPSHGEVLIRHQDGSQEKFQVDSPADRRGFFTLTVHNVQQPFHYRFQVNDAETSEYEVKTRLTPLVRSLAASEVYPPYTGLAPLNVSPNELSLLAGSTLKLHLTASTPLARATVILQGKPGQITMAIDASDPRLATVDIPIPAADLTGFTLALVDKNGVGSVNDPLYPIDIVADDPPAARITLPSDESLTVTLQTKLPIAFEVSDNYGLSRVRLHFEVTPASTGDSEPKPVESAPLDIDLQQLHPKPGATSTVTYPLVVNAQTPPWHEGDTIRYWVEAVDNNNVTGPGVTLSSSQRLLVVTPEAKRDEIFQRLEDNANIMQDILKDQADLNDQTRDDTK